MSGLRRYPQSRMTRKRIVLLGSSGSIGESTLSVVDTSGGDLEVVALASNNRWEKVLEQARRHRPSAVALHDTRAARLLEEALGQEAWESGRPRVYSGPEGLVALVRETEAEIVVGAISGAAGLPANLAALETGKDLALANKESLVMSGQILMRIAQARGRKVLPVDSEHSAIFQSLICGARHEVESIILTASGGPFRRSTRDEMRRATRADALRHPTWQMGAKITIDSATMMNKALEIIEARWLFDLSPEQIRVVIHPQSIVHSLVQFRDGSVICQMGPPDMRVPIQYALTYPERKALPVERLHLEAVAQLTFEAPDPERFPSLRLAYEALQAGGTAPAVMNAANEVAVAAFLEDAIGFTDILEIVEKTLEAHSVLPDPSLDEVFAADSWARQAATRLLTRIPSSAP